MRSCEVSFSVMRANEEREYAHTFRSITLCDCVCITRLYYISRLISVTNVTKSLRMRTTQFDCVLLSVSRVGRVYQHFSETRVSFEWNENVCVSVCFLHSSFTFDGMRVHFTINTHFFLCKCAAHVNRPHENECDDECTDQHRNTISVFRWIAKTRSKVEQWRIKFRFFKKSFARKG